MSGDLELNLDYKLDIRSRDICEFRESLSDAEIQRMLGVMSVNSLGLDLGPDHGEMMGFYPLFSNLNHSCIANSRPVKRPDFTVEVRATRRIAAGDEICFRQGLIFC